MSVLARIPAFAVVAALEVGCATKSLPPGTPPPEYEKRAFEPWPPAPLDAGVDAAKTDALPPALDGGPPPEPAVPKEPEVPR